MRGDRLATDAVVSDDVDEAPAMDDFREHHRCEVPTPSFAANAEVRRVPAGTAGS
jgi:hypothetical protein